MQFGETSAANDVLAGCSLHSKRGTGDGCLVRRRVETARALVEHGANVVGTARDRNKAAAALKLAGCKGALEVVELDLALLSSVRGCADNLLACRKPFDVIIANAGVMAVPFGQTIDGFETHLATNYLGHVLLVNRLTESLLTGSRVIMVSSAGHRGADVDLDDPSFRHTPYDPLVAYRRSETAMILFAVAFDRRHKERGVRAAAVHPGAVLTETTRKMIEDQPSAASAFTWKTVAQGTATTIWASFVASADRIGGRYCEDCHVAQVEDDPAVRSGVRSYALDTERAEALWRESARLISEEI